MCSFFPVQFSKDTGIAVLKTLMRILQDLVTKLQNLKEVTPSESTAENSQDGSDLFLETNQLTEVESNKEQVSIKSFRKHEALTPDCGLIMEHGISC